MISVAVPCYRQLDLARRALDSIRAQTYSDLEIILLDDGESDEYAEYVDSLGDSRVSYRRNPERLGAMRNMFGAITAGSGEFTMAFHEDDLLSRTYLATAVAFLEGHRACGFIACQLREFSAEPTPDELTRLGGPDATET